ncbi:MAG: hypothetical protein H0V47_13500 [Chloroflexia bacterium]|jgi:hypothetical protein|nr:hypothetical protein [Chloroflexia bacterium]
MSGWLKKVRSKISPSHADKAGDTVEKHVTEKRVDGLLGSVPGGSAVADKTPADLNTQAGDVVRGRLGWKKPGV